MILDTQINTYTTNSQFDPSITALTDGGFVVVWNSVSQDGSDTVIYGQRYNASGVPQSTEFRVKSYTKDSQHNPSVTAIPDGGFVVTWVSDNGIYGQRYDASGNTLGTEFRINSEFTQQSHLVTTLTDGGFVVTWRGNSSLFDDGSAIDIYGQRYDASGNTLGKEFRVNSYTQFEQFDSSVTALTDRGFVVTWTSWGQDGSDTGIYGQRYNASGVAQNTEFRVNSYTKNSQHDPSVTALTDGGFVMTWTSDDQDGSGAGIYGQRYNASGNTQGAEFRVNSYTKNGQWGSSVTALNDGGFVVTWDSDGQDGSRWGVYGQRYDTNGNVQGTEFHINSYTTNSQLDASVTALTDGGFVVTWKSTSQDGSGGGIYGKRYDANGNEVEWVGSSNNPGPKTPPINEGVLADEIFKSESVLSKGEKLLEGAEIAGMIRVMADFSKAAYHLEPHEKNKKINDDYSPLSDQALAEVLAQRWQSLDLNLPLTDDAFGYTIHEKGINGFGASNVKNGISNGFYNKGNAAAFVARADDAVVISFRGTNDNRDNPLDPGNKIYPDKDQWGSVFDGSKGDMNDHYDLLRPLLDKFDAYVATHNGIKKVYVTGHSLGGAMAIEYMENHPIDLDSAVTYSAITFAAPAFTVGNGSRKDFVDDDRITQIEISEDPVPQTWDVGSGHNRPGDVIRFAGNQTLDEPDWMKLFFANEANHSMDYYRQIADSVEAHSWSRILAEPGDQTVFLGGRRDGDDFFVDEGNDVLVDTDLDQEDFDQVGDDDIEIFYGGRGDDELTGGKSGELMLGGSGNDSIDGNGGVDTAFYSGPRSSFALQLNKKLLFADHRIVTDQRTGTDNDGTDTLKSIERLIFTDSGLAFDLDGSAGKVAKLIGAVFGAESVSNAGYVATGLYYLDNGTSYEDLAAGAIAFTDAKTPEQVTSLLWNNVMGSPPTADNIQLLLNLGKSIGGLGVLAAEYSLNEANIDLVGLTETGIIFDPLHYQPIG